MPVNSGESSSTTAGSASKSDSRAITINSRSYTGRSRPKTATTSSGYHDNQIICALSEARGISPTIGLSFVNVTTCEAVLCQISDTQTFVRTCHKIQVFNPSEILYAKTAEESKLLSILRENLDTETSNIQMTSIDRRYWSEGVGHEYLQQLAFPNDYEPLKLSTAGNYYALCCFGAVLKFIELELAITFAPQTLRIKFESSEGAMTIDLFTSQSLELVQNLHDAKSRDCLFGLINETLTAMGGRMLRSNILQPSTDSNKILQRYEAVAELSSKETIFYPVREALQGFVDTDKVLANLVVIHTKQDFTSREQSVNHVLMFKSFVDSISSVWKALTGVETNELREIRQLCNSENYDQIQESIAYAMNEDVTYSTQPTELRNQRVFALKAGVNEYLDLARQKYKEICKDVSDMIDELKEEHPFSLILKFDPARQFYIRIKAAELEEQQLPAIFINVHYHRDIIECQTMDLIKMNQRIKSSHDEVVELSDQSIQLLINKIQSQIHPLFKISEGIAMLDMLVGFAQLVITQNYKQPELGSTLAIKNGRHPILEKIQRNTTNKLIPNDVYATQQNRFQIITGCNMSGKSTYIRSIPLMTVMAQIGCFVPADYASFPIMHQLFARVSTDDNIEANVSTFASEMREIAFILHNLEPRSLVIVDELGRGTNTTDGLAIAIAVSEALIESRAYVWFVTHFRDLPRILAERAGVVNLHLSVDISPDFSRMKMMYKISEGYETQQYYGLALASLMDLPQQILDTAMEVSTALNARNEARKQNGENLAIAKRRKLLLKLKEQLIQARESNADEKTLFDWLKKLQGEFILRMSAIDIEAAANSADAESGGTQEATETSGTTDDVGHNIEESPDQSIYPSIEHFTSISQVSSISLKRECSVSPTISGHDLIDHGASKYDPIILASSPQQRMKPAFITSGITAEDERISKNGELLYDAIED